LQTDIKFITAYHLILTFPQSTGRFSRMKVAHFIIAILGFIPFASTNASPISSDAELAAQFNKLPRILTHQSHPLLQRDPNLKSRQSDFGLWFLKGLPSGWCTFSTQSVSHPPPPLPPLLSPSILKLTSSSTALTPTTI
jgi:hypothetical protein